MSRPVSALTGIRVHFHTSLHASLQVSDRPGVRRDTGIRADDAIEMFLPSYADFHFDDLERRQDPVQDIVVTDEEVKNMFPSS